MNDALSGRRVAVLAADGVDETDVEPAGTVPVDRVVSDASREEYGGLVLPGGTTDPDDLRQSPAAVAFVREVVRDGDLVPSRDRGDLDAFRADVVEAVAEGRVAVGAGASA